MRPSHRIETLTASGWDITRMARHMIAEGIAATERTTGEHDRPTERDSLEAIHAAAGHIHIALAVPDDRLQPAPAPRAAFHQRPIETTA